jgi:hypothetical protein
MHRSWNYGLDNRKRATQLTAPVLRATPWKHRLCRDKSHNQEEVHVLGPTGTFGVLLILLGTLVWGYHGDVWSAGQTQARQTAPVEVQEQRETPIWITPIDGNNWRLLASRS